VKKFFDYLEANAEGYWHVPSLEVGGEAADGGEQKAVHDDLYSAAYEDVTYRDSTDDDQEGSVLDGGVPAEDFDLVAEGERIARRLRFLSTVARLWQIAARQDCGGGSPSAAADRPETLAGWLATARGNQQRLLALLDAIQAYPIPEPLGSYESLVEFDRRRVLKEQLLYAAIAACLDTSLAVGALQGAVQAASPDAPAGRPAGSWGPLAVQLEQALLRGDAEQARALLPMFLNAFREEPLLFTALADGGQPRQILRVRLAQSILQALAQNLPRLGLLRETYELLQTAREMEQAGPPQGRGVTEFNHLFQIGFRAVVEAVVDATPAGEEQRLVEWLDTLTEPFLLLWIEHSQTLQLSSLEAVRGEAEWDALAGFVHRYGGGLFHARFMTLANLRSILHRGVGGYLDYLRENPDPLHPVPLIDDLDGAVRREEAERHLRVILKAVVENYAEYKDYNTTTTQSDYGENLHLLLDFLRVKAAYERHAWQCLPLVWAHEVLARKGRVPAAELWQETFREFSQSLADEHLEDLAELEEQHGMRLGTVGDRLRERFVKPLLLDRVCALIEPAMRAARQAGAGTALARLQQGLRELVATPSGVGLDVPHWLRRLEQEVQRVRAASSPVATLAEDTFRVPRKVLPVEQVERLLGEWKKPDDSE
jgi:hypothetical protein